MPEQPRNWTNFTFDTLKSTLGLTHPAVNTGLDVMQRIYNATNSPAPSPEQTTARESAEKAAEQGREDRTTFMGEAARSLYLRQTPGWATAGFDLGKFLMQENFGTKDPSEVYAYQHEIEAALAIGRMCPDFLLRPLMSPIMNAEPLKTLILNWPNLAGFAIAYNDPEDFKRRIEEKDPHAWIDAIRIIHQDLITSMVTYQKFTTAMNGLGINFGSIMPNIPGLSGPTATPSH